MIKHYSNQVWQNSVDIFNKITQHQFNQELMSGTLARDKFAYYIEQDSLYLKDFARCNAIIASKIPLKYMRNFLQYADYTFIAEQEIVHQFFNKIFDFKPTGLISTATLGYTSYLLRICTNEPVEVAVAAILPCFWIYREVGLFIAKSATPDNQYIRWIETYSSEEFSKTVDEVIDVFDNLASKATQDTRDKMQNAFYKSTMWEWHFWNDAYRKQNFASENI